MSELERASRTALDQKLLTDSGTLSPAEIGEKYGLSASDVTQRVTALLNSRDWLTLRQMEMRLLIEIEDIKNEARDRLRGMDDESYGQTLKAVTGLFTLVQNTIVSRKKDIQIDLDELTAHHARMFGQAFDIALDYVKRRVVENNDGIDADEVDGYVRNGLRLAAKSLEERVTEE